MLKRGSTNSFGEGKELSLTDPGSPLNSTSIKLYLESLVLKQQVVCLIFDQFEELYSKPELFGIFKAAKDLMLDIAGFKSNIVLGFAWKTDSTTQQDHPAYHIWHDLADYRREFRLEVFDSGEISNSLTKFEKEVGQKITAEIRHQISQSSQGFPWLLKKLCINLYEGINNSEDTESLFVDLDIGRLFEADLNSLSNQEMICLKLVAQKAPADWSEIIEISGIAALNSLVNKRLIIKSGDRLNVYWDIFKDYLLSGKVPVVPYNYIPTTDVSSVLNMCKYLNVNEFVESHDISDQVKLDEKTVLNVGADMVMLGLAERKGSSFKMREKIEDNEEAHILKHLRETMSKHSLKLALFKKISGKSIPQHVSSEILKACLPKAKYGEKTWNAYSNRLINYFLITGFLLRAGQKIVIQDSGSVVIDKEGLARREKQRGKIFSVSTSPYVVLEAMNMIGNDSVDPEKILRNALTALKRFELVSIIDGYVSLNSEFVNKSGGRKEAIWSAAKNERAFIRCIEIMKENYNIDVKDLAGIISDENNLNWSESSKARNGSILKQWSSWIQQGIDSSSVPHPPGRSSKSMGKDQPDLLSFDK